MRKPDKGQLLDSLHEPSDEQLTTLMQKVGEKVAARRESALAIFWRDLGAAYSPARAAVPASASRHAPQA